MIAFAVLVIAAVGAGEGDVPPAPPPKDDAGAWSFAAVPRLTLSSDDGLGFGVRGTAFWQRLQTSPYKTAIHFQAFATSELVQHHFVRIDAIDAFHVPLRLEVEAALFSTLGANFCGLGDVVDVPTCAEGERSRHRFFSPAFSTIARWRVVGQRTGAKLEMLAGHRLALIVPGALALDGISEGPYPDSTLAARDPTGDPGTSSQLLAGFVVDSRDFEPAPSKGIFASLLVRGADKLTGSSWSWAGATVSFAVFTPLSSPRGPSLVAAQRLIVDVLVGDPPLVELMRSGGLSETFAFGGQDLGRGLRSSRFAGAVKLMSQHELRLALAHLDVLDNDLGIGVALFVDVGAVASDVSSALRRAPVPSFGGGVGVRASWNRAFVMRVDLALSPLESERIGLYTAPGHPF